MAGMRTEVEEEEEEILEEGKEEVVLEYIVPDNTVEVVIPEIGSA
jgi:hypothetical protein